MTKRTRLTIDWMPGPAAIAAIEKAKKMRPHLANQELYDLVAIFGVDALETQERWTVIGSRRGKRDDWK